MKIYGIADIHLLNRRKIGNDKFDIFILNNMEDFLESVEERSLVIIAGDLFNSPLINSVHDFEFAQKLINIFNKYINEKNIKFIISSGNHDLIENANIDDNKENKMLVESDLGLFPLLSKLNNINLSNENRYLSFSELENINLVSGDYKRFILERENTTIDVIPYKREQMKEYERIFKETDSKNKILVCHGVVEDEFEYNSNDCIPSRLVGNYDIVIKGHIHTSYSFTMDKKRITVVSPGAFIKHKKDNTSSYVLIDLYSSLEKPLIETHNFSSKYDINYIDKVCDETNINKTLKLCDDMCIANILYKGDHESIDEQEFLRCYNECLKFNFIFEKEFTNLISSDYYKEGSEDIFIKLDDYIKENIKDENIIKLYNEMKDS